MDPDGSIANVNPEKGETMSRRWLVIGSALITASFVSGADEAPPCRSHLVHCNIGDAYSGTVHRVSVLMSATGKTSEDITVHILRGKARCEGTITSTDASVQTGPVKGEGLLIVEWGAAGEDAPEPWYRIAASCPGPGGSSPARTDSNDMDTYKQPRRSGFSLLKGSVQDEHPDADSVNGVTGTVRLEWSLSRDGK